MATETISIRYCDGCHKVLDKKECEYIAEINMQITVPGHGGYNEFGGGHEGRKNDFCKKCGVKLAAAYRSIVNQKPDEAPAEVILKDLIFQLKNSGWVDKIGHPIENNVVFQRAEKSVYGWESWER